MLNLLYFFMIVPILFCSQANVMIDLFSEVNMIEIYNDGQVIEMTKEEQEKFDELFCSAISDARQMPAFGVSLHDLTIEEMKHGIWVKFIFGKTMIKSEMPFDELLINVQKDCHGFNIIRGNDGRYEGRCYYFDLDGTLDDVYDFLSNLKNKNQNDVHVELENQEIEDVSIMEEKDENKNNGEGQEKQSNGNNGKPFENMNDSSDDNNDENMNKSQRKLLEYLE